MYYLIDSAELGVVKEAMGLPFVNGVTTNAREVAYHAGDDLRGYLYELRSLARGSMYVQVTQTDADTMIKEGVALSKAVPNLRVKIPVTTNGLIATRALTDMGVAVSGTAVNTVTMALLAAKAGAVSVIPYYGVLEEFEAESPTFLDDIVSAYKTYGLSTELVYFARTVRQTRAGIRAGATGCLMTLDGLKSLVDEPLAQVAIGFMNETWRKRFGSKTWADALSV